MISGGDSGGQTVQRYSGTAHGDLDFAKDFVQSFGCCPVAKETCNDDIYFQQEADQTYRAQFSSEIPGKYGREGGGWSAYSFLFINIPVPTLVLQRVEDGAAKKYGKELFSDENPESPGVPTADAQTLADGMACSELQDQLNNPTIVAQNSCYALGLWMDQHREEALTHIPKELIQGCNHQMGSDGKTLFVDTDYNENFGSDMTLLLMNPERTVNRVLASAATFVGEPAFAWISCSEVNLPELGKERLSSKGPHEPDRCAPNLIYAIPSGVRILQSEGLAVPVWKGLSYKPSIPWDRLVMHTATAAVAAGINVDHFVRAREIEDAASSITSLGRNTLPKKDQSQIGKFLKATFDTMIRGGFGNADGNVRAPD